MYLPKFILLAVFLMFTAFAYAQNSNSPTEDKYTPSTSSIFSIAGKKNDGSSSDVEVNFKNNIRFSPTFAVRQKIVFFYERDLFSGLALNVGIGRAFGKDWMQDAYFNWTDTPTQELDPYEIFSYSEFIRSSIFMAGGAKIYYSGNTFERGYFELFARYETQTYLLNEDVNGYTILGEREFTFKTMTYGFGIGIMGLSGNKNNITHDFFMHLGIKFIDVPQFERVVFNNGFFEETNFLNTNTTQRLRLIPAINFGYAIGFGW